MKRLVACLTIFSTLGLGAAILGARQPQQRPAAIKWTLSLSARARPVPGGTFAALATATIEPGWKLYAMAQPDGGPIPTNIALAKDQPFVLANSIAEPEPTKLRDPNFPGLTSLTFETMAIFTLPVRVPPEVRTGRQNLTVTVKFQVCSDRVCLAPASETLTAPVPINDPAPVPPPDPANSDDTTLRLAVEARSIADPQAKLDALAKVRAEFANRPHFGNFFSFIDEATLTTLYRNFPDRHTELAAAFERVVANMAPLTKLDDRFDDLLSVAFQQNVVSELIEKKLLLDRIEQVMLETVKAAGSDYDGQRAMTLVRLGYIAVAKGDAALADRRFAESLQVAPDAGTAAGELIDYFLKTGQQARAEEATRLLIRSFPSQDAAGAAAVRMADVAIKNGGNTLAEKWVRDAVGRLSTGTTKAPGPNLARALLRLAQLEEKRGADTPALERYMLVTATQSTFDIGREPWEATRSLYQRVRGTNAGLDAALDAISRRIVSVDVREYKPTAVRSQKTVLVEAFSGSGCAPCIGGDLAVDALFKRYTPREIVVLSYHQSIPRPDPMVVSGGLARADYYNNWGVPGLRFDGTVNDEKAAEYGGPRSDAQWMFEDFSAEIDSRLTRPAEAQLSVSASVKGDVVTARATVSKLTRATPGLRLHLILAEREVSYAGENGIRLHPMLVRAVAGTNGAGLPLAAPGDSEFSFSLTAIKADVRQTLAAEVQRRRENRAAAGNAPNLFVVEKHDVTAIDPANLVIVAFVQSSDKQVLQATQSNVKVLR